MHNVFTGKRYHVGSMQLEKEDIKYLKANYKKLNLCDLAFHLGISPPTVAKRLQEMGLREIKRHQIKKRKRNINYN